MENILFMVIYLYGFYQKILFLITLIFVIKESKTNLLSKKIKVLDYLEKKKLKNFLNTQN